MDVIPIIEYLEDRNRVILDQMREIDSQITKIWTGNQKERQFLIETQRVNSESANRLYREMREAGLDMNPAMVLKLHGDAARHDLKVEEAQNKMAEIMKANNEAGEKLRQEMGYYDLRDQMEKNKSEIKRLSTPIF